MLNQGPEYREPTTMPEISRLHPEKLLLFTHQPLYMYIRVAYWHTSVTGPGRRPAAPDMPDGFVPLSYDAWRPLRAQDRNLRRSRCQS